MRGYAVYLGAGIGVLGTLAVVAPHLGLGWSVSARSVVPPGTAIQYVDRSHKGDRMTPAVTIVDKHPMRPQPSKVMEGCDPAFSSLSKGAGANYSGRCAA